MAGHKKDKNSHHPAAYFYIWGKCSETTGVNGRAAVGAAHESGVQAHCQVRLEDQQRLSGVRAV